MLGHQPSDLVITVAFRAGFGEPNNLAGYPEAIPHVANQVMDFRMGAEPCPVVGSCSIKPC
jgi:hypothetical protein